MIRQQFKLDIKFKKDDFIWRCSDPTGNECRVIWRITSAWKDSDGDVWYRARIIWVKPGDETFFRKVGLLKQFRQRTGVHAAPPLLVLAAMA